jgi:hypothetical protein
MDNYNRKYPHIRKLRTSQLDDVLLQLRNDMFVVHRIDDVTDAKSFFAFAKNNLPLDPPLSGRVNWDAFSDSLWNGIDETQNHKVAICWVGADVMRRRDPKAFRIAIDCLNDVAATLQDEYRQNGVEFEIAVLLFERDEK